MFVHQFLLIRGLFLSPCNATARHLGQHGFPTQLKRLNKRVLWAWQVQLLSGVQEEAWDSEGNHKGIWQPWPHEKTTTIRSLNPYIWPILIAQPLVVVPKRGMPMKLCHFKGGPFGITESGRKTQVTQMNQPVADMGGATSKPQIRGTPISWRKLGR